MTVLTIRAAATIAIALVPGISAAAQPGRESQPSLQKLLIGKWQQTVHRGITRTEFHADGTFSFSLDTHIKGGHPATRIEGHWQIRGNQLRMRNESWSPTSFRFPNGTTRKITVEPWTTTTITVIDADHVRMNDAIAVRLKEPGRSRPMN